MAPFLARQERFDRVASTNDVVLDWLSRGTAEVCLAVADEQTAGRGRAGRDWVAPQGAALLLSLGFRPTWLEPDRVWRLAAVVSLAMADAAEAVAGLPDRTIRLKWPNDLVVEADASPATDAAPTDDAAADAAAAAHDAAAPDAAPDGPGVRKLAGVLGETEGLGTADPRAVIGLGINADWRAAEFPSELADSMTSLREVSLGRRIDLPRLLDAFLDRLEAGIGALRAGDFDATGWADRQVTTGRLIRLEGSDQVAQAGGTPTVRALGVDSTTGALVVEDRAVPGGERGVVVGEISHVRLATAGQVRV